MSFFYEIEYSSAPPKDFEEIIMKNNCNLLRSQLTANTM